MNRKSDGFDPILYINSGNINYIVNQMKERQLVYMANNSLFIIKENLFDFLEKIGAEKNFMKVKMKENGLDSYINFNNVESALACRDGSVILNFLSGKNIVALSSEGIIEKLTKISIEK